MTENQKKFLEYISAQDQETMEKLSKMEKDELIAFTAEKGLTLTDADLEYPESDEALSLDDIASVAGGGACACAVGGGGTQDLRENEDGTKTGDCLCVCVGGGLGDGKDSSGVKSVRCGCVVGGGGKSVV